jgi:hypothetical protein
VIVKAYAASAVFRSAPRSASARFATPVT